MSKRKYRFGKAYFTRFWHAHAIMLIDSKGNKAMMWRKRTGQRDAQMSWAFPLPKPPAQ